jgi:hypothetical protein
MHTSISLSPTVTISEIQRDTHKKNVCVVGRLQFRLTSSVVVTFVHVMHRETTWPANKLRANRLVHRLANRRQTLARNAAGESYTIGGRPGAAAVWP